MSKCGCGCNANGKSNEDIRETVRSGYAEIAMRERSCRCSGQRSGQADPEHLAKDAESLAALPEGANMGLSCGNPVAIAARRER